MSCRSICPSYSALPTITPATAATPVIFMTAKVQAAEVAQYRELGAIDVIHKPFDPMELSAQLGRIWAVQGQ